MPSLFSKLPCGLETGFGWAKPVRYPTVIPWKEGHFEGTQVTLLKVERCPIGSLWSGRSSWWLTWHYCAHHLQTRCPPFPPDLNRLIFFFFFATPCGMWEICSQLGIESMPSAAGVCSLNHRTARGVSTGEILSGCFFVP